MSIAKQPGSIQKISRGKSYSWGNETIAPRVSKLVHKPTGYYFLFDFQLSGTHCTEYSPADERIKFSEQHVGWDQRWKHVANWAKYLAREIEAAAFVKTVMEEPSLDVVLTDENNAPFSEPEQDLLLERLAGVEQHIIEMKTFACDQSASIRREFDVLREELKRAGRTAWFRQLVCSVIWIGKMFFGKDEASAIWYYVSEKFSSAARLIHDKAL